MYLPPIFYCSKPFLQIFFALFPWKLAWALEKECAVEFFVSLPLPRWKRLFTSLVCTTGCPESQCLHLGRTWSCWGNPWQCCGEKGLRVDIAGGDTLSCSLSTPAIDSEAEISYSGGRGREMVLKLQRAPSGTNRSSRMHAEMWIAQHLLLSDNHETASSYILWPCVNIPVKRILKFIGCNEN